MEARPSSTHLAKEVRMKKILLAGVAALAIAGTTVVYAQHRPWFEHMRMSPEDRAAMADARIAAVHAGLKLTPDQEKLWPPLEAAVRDFAKMRIDRANARMKAMDEAQSQAQQGQAQQGQGQQGQAQQGQPPQGQAQTPQKPDDPVARLRERADNMA